MKNQKGFTLVELLVVIAIIGILSSVAVVNLNSARDKAQIAAVKGSLASLATAGELYYDDNNGSYTGFCAGATVGNATTTASANNSLVATDFDCAETSSAWALSVDLDDFETGAFYCISNSGSGDTDNAGGTTCP